MPNKYRTHKYYRGVAVTDHLVDVAGGIDGEEEDNDMVVCTDQIQITIMTSRQTDQS